MKTFDRIIKYGSRAALVLVAVVVVGSGSFVLGYGEGTKHPKNVIVKGITNIGDPDATADFSIFWEAWDELKKSHIDGAKAKDQDLVYGSVGGLASAFKDPHTIFLPPDDAEKFDEDIRGEFGGIGAEIGLKFDQIVVVAPLSGSPAERVGLKAGDKILEVDGTSTAGISVGDAVKLIRGEIGTTVTLTIFRDGFADVKKIPIVRDVIRVPTVDIKPLEIDPSLTYVKLHSFNEVAPQVFYEQAVSAVERGTKGIILDLRNNPGGFLEVAVDLAGWFLERGKVVVKEEFREEFADRNREFSAHGNEAFKSTPIVILVNNGSASASEILAGALRDHRHIQLVGEQTFGKGTVQELRPLSHEGATLKITVARWVLPNGGTIEKNGLKPDVLVKPAEGDGQDGNDVQLTKAIEVLKAEIQKTAKAD